MAISTNSIIHYTKSLGIVEDILREGFKIKYCAEKLLLTKNNKSSAAAHPMISFCDIPLTSSFDHIKSYGPFGIGLTKEWAAQQGVSPVLYIDKGSDLASSIYFLMTETRRPDGNLNKKQRKEIFRIKAYAKNYSGDFSRLDKVFTNYKFYSEREWRIVPDSKTLGGASFSVRLSEYEKDKDKYNNSISSCRIKFDYKDISYLIVENNSDIPKIIKILNRIYSGISTEEQFLLYSKVCSIEQIKSDY